MRALSGDISGEFEEREEKGRPTSDLVAMIDEIVDFNCKHNAEFDAVDLLVEVEMLAKMLPYIDVQNAPRVCRYIVACSEYAADADDRARMIVIAMRGYLKARRGAAALACALKLPVAAMRSAGAAAADAEMESGDEKDAAAGPVPTQHECVLECFAAFPNDAAMQQQMGYIIGAQKGCFAELEQYDAAWPLAGNTTLSQLYLTFGKELDVLDPKTPEDIYKTHLEVDPKKKPHF